eukprot:evm.model.scf_1880.1 EVM.evm.TU.scf_1880.1   scf_1880:11803-12027(-)
MPASVACTHVVGADAALLVAGAGIAKPEACAAGGAFADDVDRLEWGLLSSIVYCLRPGLSDAPHAEGAERRWSEV